MIREALRPREKLRNALRGSLPPEVFVALRSVWQLRPSWKDRRHQGQRISKAVGTTVKTGPFAGMAYLSLSSGSQLYPKIVGSYESELQPHLDELMQQPFRTVIDIGAAEGYYAVGIARRLPTATVIAYDIDRMAQRSCKKLAQLNKVSVDVRGECTHEELQQECGPETLLLSDCEGCEGWLLNPDHAPSLRCTTMVVECHDHLEPGVSDLLVRRFRPTHDIVFVTATPKDPDLYPFLASLPADDRAEAVDEKRTAGMRWAVLRPVRP